MRVLVAMAVVTGCLALASGAGAATMSIDGGAPHFVAGAGENNRVAFGPVQSYDAQTNTFGPYEGMGLADQLRSVTPGTGCSTSGSGILCRDVQPNITFTVDLGDGDDDLEPQNIRDMDPRGNDPHLYQWPVHVTAGPGHDAIFGSQLDDFIDLSGDPSHQTGVRTTVTDEARCGGGNDTVIADPDDRVIANCENVTRVGAKKAAGACAAKKGAKRKTCVKRKCGKLKSLRDKSKYKACVKRVTRKP
jgi:hypothetical protein